MQGWVKVHRSMMDNQIIMKSPDHLAVWMFLLLHATHTEQKANFKGKELILKPGQLITGRKMIAEKINISESKVHRVLALFEAERLIEQQTSNKNRLIYLPAWDKQQSAEQQEQQVNGKMNNKTGKIEQQSEQQKNSLKQADNKLFDDCENGQVNGKVNNKTGKSERQSEHKEECNIKNEIKNEIIICPEQAPDRSGILLPLVDKSFYDVPLSLIEQWKMAYPSVNIEQELQKMIAWLNANPTRKRTRKGIERFVVSWLNRAQDSGGRYIQQPAKPVTKSTGFTNFEQREYDFDELERQLLDAQGQDGSYN